MVRLRAFAITRAVCLFLRAIRTCELLQKFCKRVQASTRVIFASNSSDAKFASNLTLNGTIRYPYFINSLAANIDQCNTALNDVHVQLCS